MQGQCTFCERYSQVLTEVGHEQFACPICADDIADERAEEAAQIENRARELRR